MRFKEKCGNCGREFKERKGKCGEAIKSMGIVKGFQGDEKGGKSGEKYGNYEHFRENFESFAARHTSNCPSLGLPRLVQGPGGGLDQDPGEHLQELDQRQPEGDGAHPGGPQHRLLRRSQVRYIPQFFSVAFLLSLRLLILLLLTVKYCCLNGCTHYFFYCYCCC